jgi:hypothetical protein
LKLCINNCSYPNGTCNYTTGVCECVEPFDGLDCSFKLCPGDCIHNSTCDRLSGTCICQPGWTGPVCALVKCPGDCSRSGGQSNGQCIGGVCNCFGKWTGPACNIEEPDYVFIAILAIALGLAGLALIVGGFFIWRQITIAQLRKKLAETQQDNSEENKGPEEISSSDDSGL